MKTFFDKVTKVGRRTLYARGLLRTRKNEKSLKWGIVGTGYMAKVWADLLLTSTEGELWSVCSRSAENAKSFGRKFGIQRCYEGIDEMLNQEAADLDFVYIATPLSSHAELVRICIEAGANILVEKPATPKADAWAELSRLAKQRGVLLIEGMWMRCLPTFRQASSWIEAGEIGQLNTIRVDFHKYVGPAFGASQGHRGLLLDFGVYGVDFVSHFLSGFPDTVYGTCTKDNFDCDSDWSVIAKKGAATAFLNMSIRYTGRSVAVISGSQGLIEWTAPFNRTNEIVLHSFVTGETTRRVFKYTHEGFEFQLAEATSAARQGLLESGLLPHEKTLNTLMLTDKLQEEISRQD